MGNSFFKWECPYCQNINTEDISYYAPEQDGTMDCLCGQCQKQAKIEIEVQVQKVTGYLAHMIDRAEQ